MTRIGILALVLVAVMAGTEATAGAASKASPSVSKKLKQQSKRLKQLTAQIARLQQQLADLQGQGAPPAPPAPSLTGPAGGDLTGTFPNPLIGPNAVGSAEIADGAVGDSEIGPNSVGNVDLVANAVEQRHIQTDAVDSDEIKSDAVGASELGPSSVGANDVRGITTAVSAGAFVGPDSYNTASVTCPGGRLLIAGGFAWRDKEANSIIYSAPLETNPRHTWEVRGYVPSGASDNQLFAWATCLGA